MKRYRSLNRKVIEDLILSVPLLIIGIFVLLRWEQGDILYWVACAVFVGGSIAFLLWKRHCSGDASPIR